MPKVEVAIQPEILRWVKRVILEQCPVTRKAQDQIGLLDAWMKKEQVPTLAKVEQLSKDTRIPFGYFFLQHPPEKIVEMYRLWQQGYEVVEGQKSSRGKESAAHAWAARSFYSIISAAVGFDMSKASDFKLLDRKAVNVLLNMRESNAFFRALSSWIGFRTAVVPFDVQEREAGVSKWSTKALVKYAVSNITSFSTLPMQLITLLGVVVFVVSCVLGGIALVQKFTGRALGGFTTVILILLFSSSVIMISLGIIGYYIARIYEEIKGRPRYIVAKECGAEKQEEPCGEAEKVL